MPSGISKSRHFSVSWVRTSIPFDIANTFNTLTKQCQHFTSCRYRASAYSVWLLYQSNIYRPFVQNGIIDSLITLFYLSCDLRFWPLTLNSDEHLLSHGVPIDEIIYANVCISDTVDYMALYVIIILVPLRKLSWTRYTHLQTSISSFVIQTWQIMGIKRQYLALPLWGARYLPFIYRSIYSGPLDFDISEFYVYLNHF